MFETYPVSNVPVWSGLNNQNSTVVNGDFDADGKSDMIIYSTSGPTARNQYTLITNLTGNNVNNANHNNSVGNFEDIFAVTYTNFSNILFPQQGWCVVKKNGAKYTFQTHNSWIGISSPPPLYLQTARIVNFPGISSTTCNINCVTSTNYVTSEKRFINGDFNGDGLTDVIAFDLPTTIGIGCRALNSHETQDCRTNYSTFNSRKVYYVDLNPNVSSFLYLAGTLTIELSIDTNIQVVDFNGDGKSDIMVMREGNVQYYSLNENNQLVQIYNYSEPAFQINKPLLLGD